jgi:hypothetical protein
MQPGGFSRGYKRLSNSGLLLARIEECESAVIAGASNASTASGGAEAAVAHAGGLCASMGIATAISEDNVS